MPNWKSWSEGLPGGLEAGLPFGKDGGAGEGSMYPSSRDRYDGGGLDAPRVVGDCGLRERGAEKVRIGRGRGGVNSCSESVLLLEITDAFLLRSAKVC